eukprot:1160653-Pelagomonas_calceolata.AAC.10
MSRCTAHLHPQLGSSSAPQAEQRGGMRSTGGLDGARRACADAHFGLRHSGQRGEGPEHGDAEVCIVSMFQAPFMLTCSCHACILELGVAHEGN